MEMRTMPMKHVNILIFLMFCFPATGSGQAWAEGFIDIYGGGSVTRNADAKVSRNVSSLGTVSREVDTEKVDFGSSFTAGYRFGCWSEKYPYLGIAGDLSYFKAGNEALKVYTVPMSFLLMARWPLLKGRDFPKGKIQPYVGIGPGFFFSYSEADFRPNLSDTVSGISLDMGVDVRFGNNQPALRACRVQGYHWDPGDNQPFSYRDIVSVLNLLTPTLSGIGSSAHSDSFDKRRFRAAGSNG
jgi:hypothetical protein